MSNTTEELVAVLRAIVLETMDHPPVKPHSCESYLPRHLLMRAENALANYDATTPKVTA